MTYRIKKEGSYELFYTTNDNPILKLGRDWFAIVEGQGGEIIVGSDSDHEKKETISKGEFMLIEFENDSKFKDVPHLFLEKGNSFTEAILPRGLPSKKGDREKIIRTDNTIGKKALEDHLKGSS